MSNTTKIAEFIEDNLVESGQSVSADTALFSSGLLDSFHLIELLMFLEGTFSVKITPQELTPDTMDTPAAIANLVQAAQK